MELKYPKEVYLDCHLYEDDDEVKCYKKKIVKIRKQHDCSLCERRMKKGDYAFFESGLLYGEWVKSYTCVKCVELWLEESGQV